MARTRKGKKPAEKEKFYEIDMVLARRRNHMNDRVEYLVQWKDLPSDRATWEPEENLTPQLQEQMKEKFSDKAIAAATAEPIPSTSKAGSGNKSVELKKFSITISAKRADDVIKEMVDKGIYVKQDKEWEYRFNPQWDFPEPNPPEEDDDDEDFVPGSSKQVRRHARVAQTVVQKAEKVKGRKTVGKSASASKPKPVESTRSSSRRRSKGDLEADLQIAAFNSEFTRPTISLEDIAGDIEEDLDPIANDEEVVINVDADTLNIDFMYTDPFTLAAVSTDFDGSEEVVGADPAPKEAPPSKKSPVAVVSLPKPSAQSLPPPPPPPLKVLPTLVPRLKKNLKEKIRDPEVSSTTTEDAAGDEVPTKKKKSLPSNELKQKTSINTADKNVTSKVEKRNLPPTAFEAQLNTPTPLKNKMKRIKKTPAKGSSLKNIATTIPLRNLDTSDDGSGATSKTTITPVLDDEPAVEKKAKKETPIAPPPEVVLPVEQVVKTDLIKLEKKSVGMLVDPKAQKPSSNLTSLKEQLRLARMKSMPPTPVFHPDDQPTTSATADTVTATDDGAWDDEWASEAPAVTPAKAVEKPVKPSKSASKSTSKPALTKCGKKAKPLAGQSGQNSNKKVEIRGLTITGFKIPKKAPPKEVQPVSENLEDTWGMPFQPELVNLGPSSSSGPSSTSAPVTAVPAASSADWGAGDVGWD